MRGVRLCYNSPVWQRHESRQIWSALHASLLMELSEASASVRARGRLCSHIQKTVLNWVECRIFSLTVFFFSLTASFMSLRWGQPGRENSYLSAFQQFTSAVWPLWSRNAMQLKFRLTVYSFVLLFCNQGQILFGLSKQFRSQMNFVLLNFRMPVFVAGLSSVCGLC